MRASGFSRKGLPTMETPKSRDGVYALPLFKNMLSDCAKRNPSIQKTIARDVLEMERRFACEGIQFFTMALPRLGKALEKGLETGVLPQTEGFKSISLASTIPLFLQGMWLQVFDNAGYLLDEPCIDTIRDLRQVCALLYKLSIPFKESQLDDAYSKFVGIDASICDWYDADVSAVLSFNVKRILNRIFEGFDPKDILPRHGPGAVATGEKLEQKWSFKRLYNCIHQSYPYYEYYVVGGARELLDRVNWYRGLERIQSGCAKVVPVPKDSRGPRLISSEPLEYQYIQQGLGRAIVTHVEKRCGLTRGQVNFASQEVNRRLALECSRTRASATLDLSEASDRVPLWAIDLFPEVMQPYLLNTRTTHTRLPNGVVVQMRKYAPMGSALCFPVESVLFYAICVASRLGTGPLRESEAFTDTYVYGDDIIVPVDHYEKVCKALEAFGLVVNRGKSFAKGKFRESCGVDAYDGVDITPIKIRTLWSGSSSDGKAFASWVSYYNSLSKRYPMTAAFIGNMLEATYGKVPYGVSTSPYPCIAVRDKEYAAMLNELSGVARRWNKGLQRFEYRVKTLSSNRIASVLDGWCRLLRNQLAPSVCDPNEVVVPSSTKIKVRWRAV